MLDTLDSIPIETFWREDPFGFIRPESFQSLGIDPADIPPGTFAAQRHPSQIESRFGGNAYGFGLFELSERLDPGDLELLQSVSEDDPDQIRRNYREINRIYRELGLLIRFSSRGRPYYLIPEHLVSSSLSHIRNKAEEIGKIIEFHRRKVLKENHTIGIITHTDDLLVNNLSVRFKEHRFVVLDSLDKLKAQNEPLDLVIVSRDIQEILIMERFLGVQIGGGLSRHRLEQYASYLMAKVYRVLKPGGEVFIIANHYPRKSGKAIRVTFKSEREKKSFLLFTHIFRTRRRYQLRHRTIRVNVFEFQKFLRGVYVEQEVIDRLLGGKRLEDMLLNEIRALPYLNYPLEEETGYDQERLWPRLFGVFFEQIALKPFVPTALKAEWRRRFSASGYTPRYKLTYLGQKKPVEVSFRRIKEEIETSRLAGCPLSLLADYRDSFGFVIGTLNVLKEIKDGSYSGMPEVFMARLRQPFENKRRRYPGLNEVIHLMNGTRRLERIRSRLNPEGIEGPVTPVLEHLEILPFFGLTPGELKEIYLIVVGHTPMGRVLSGKMTEKALKPLSDRARREDPVTALNLLRYCRVMTMAETVASRGAQLRPEHLSELFDLYESVVRVVTARDMDWDRLLDEKISQMGGIHNMIVRKVLKLMDLVDHFQFLDSWEELGHKGDMEKESLADYDPLKLQKIENIIRLIDTIKECEEKFLREDPLEAAIFYRKFLNVEFHGTGHLFERMDSRLAFILLWITVNVLKGEVINFNPILGEARGSELMDGVRRVEEEARAINLEYLDLETLDRFSRRLYADGTGFIMGTGFHLRIDPETQALNVGCVDLDQVLLGLEELSESFAGSRISGIPPEVLEEFDRRFSHLESFYVNHSGMIQAEQGRWKDFGFPPRQRAWMNKAAFLREFISDAFRRALFEPEHIHDDLAALHGRAYTLFSFLLPEVSALAGLDLAGHSYLKDSPIEYILTNTRKLQALIRRERREFQNDKLLHELAQREFGPMTAGTVGVSQAQISELEGIAARLRKSGSIFEALVKSFVFQDLGRVPELRWRHRDYLHPADHALSGALFLEKERIPERYGMKQGARDCLLRLVRYHDFMHHILRGEFSPYALGEVVALGDKDLFDAFFVNSIIMLLSLREDLILEDLAGELFKTRLLCHRAIEGRESLEGHFDEIHARLGRLQRALEAYQTHGLPQGENPVTFLESREQKGDEDAEAVAAGRSVASMERIFRLRGLKYVQFPDLVRLMLKLPLRYVYKKRGLHGVGYPSFERELYEAYRVYRSIESLSDSSRSFILRSLAGDKVRLFGFENVSGYLSYENQVKILLVVLMGAGRLEDASGAPVNVSFLELMEKIGCRYEALNHTLNGYSSGELWEGDEYPGLFLRSQTGLLLRMDRTAKVVVIDFVDQFHVGKRLSHMESITDLDQLKDYFHYTLRSLRKIPFYTEDYEHELEKTFERRRHEITDFMLSEVKKEMDGQEDFAEINRRYQELMARSLDIGFTDEQKSKLRDLYELRKDELKRKKLEEISNLLRATKRPAELREHWDRTKWFLYHNRPYLGKEFENMIARRFDETMAELGEREPC